MANDDDDDDDGDVVVRKRIKLFRYENSLAKFSPSHTNEIINKNERKKNHSNDSK